MPQIVESEVGDLRFPRRGPPVPLVKIVPEGFALGPSEHVGACDLSIPLDGPEGFLGHAVQDHYPLLPGLLQGDDEGSGGDVPVR
jgi:hypothetical protein